MTRDWEDSFSSWAKPPGKTEQDRCDNAVQALRKAIAASDKLNQRNIKVLVHGSYQNNTNVRQDSDVDIGIVCFDTFFMVLPEGSTREDFNISPATYEYRQFKDEVNEALVAYFGRSAVTRGNKAFDVHENSYRVDADAAPFFEHRRYSKDKSYISGVELQPDTGGRVINWPEQHYDNGVVKNTETNRRFKALVRIMKALCNEMLGAGIQEAKPIPGFLAECLIWNVPNDHFGYASYKSDVQNCIAFLFNNTMRDEQCGEWGEVSELKYLFRWNPWTRAQAHSFLSAAWDYIGLG